MGRLWWVVSAVLVAVGACRSSKPVPMHRSSEPKVPCKDKAALQVLARFQADTMDKIGASGQGLYTGQPAPEKLRDLGMVLRRGSRAMAGLHSGAAEIDDLLHRRATLFQDMAKLFDEMAAGKDAGDKRAVEKAREALFAKRALELGIRKDLRRRFQACHLKPPI